MSNLQQFLRFQIQPFDSADRKPNLMALIEVNLVTELVNVPIDRVVPIPHLPPLVTGVYNWRGEMLWIVDLAMLLGTRTCSLRTRSLQPTLILSNVTKNETRQHRTVGFVVDEIAEIESYDLDAIVPVDIGSQFSRWVSGLCQSTNGENLLVLNGHKILNEADFHAVI